VAERADEICLAKRMFGRMREEQVDEVCGALEEILEDPPTARGGPGLRQLREASRFRKRFGSSARASRQ